MEHGENIKPFDHKPDKYGSDGKVFKRDSYGCYIANGGKYYYKYDIPGKFYTENGLFIPLDQVPDEVKRNVGSKPVKAKEVAGRIQRGGSEKEQSVI